MKYTEKVMGIVKTALSQLERVNGQIEELSRRFKAESISGMDYAAQKSELEKRCEAIRSDVERQLVEASEGYRAAVEKGNEIDGAMLHEDAKLLQLDLKMTAHQFEALVEKHRDNPLMTQLLKGYSDKHEGLYAGFLPTADAKIAVFEDFIGAARNAIRTPDSMQAALFQDGKYTPQYCTEAE